MSSDSPALLGGPPAWPPGPPTWPPVIPGLEEGLRTTLGEGSWGRYDGPWTRRLQAQLREFHQVESAHLTCSGTAAVELALRGLGVSAGDEVILAGYDFKGNFQDVLAIGAVPVLVDVRPDDWMLDVRLVSQAIGPQTKAIIASHLHGAQVDMPALRQLADAARVPILEDACQAPGATVRGRIAGGWGDVAVLSFGGSKLVTAGRGGAVLTSRPDVIQRIRLHVLRGNDAYPLSELQAAALVPQWELLRAWNGRRRVAVERLRDGLRRGREEANGSGESRSGRGPMAIVRPFTDLPADSAGAYYKWGLMFVPEAAQGLTRDQFALAVRAEGVALDPGLRALHRIHSARRFRTSGNLETAAAADSRVLTLHHPILLGSESELEAVQCALEKTELHAERLASWFRTQGAVGSSPQFSQWGE